MFKNSRLVTQTLADGKRPKRIINKGNKVMMTPLETCVSLPLSDREMIDLLIKRGASLINFEFTILYIAAISKSKINGSHVSHHLLKYDSVRALLNTKVVNLTPLSYAYLYSNIDAVLYYLKAGGIVLDMFEQDFLIILELCRRQQ